MNESNREKIKYSDIGKLWGKTLKQQMTMVLTAFIYLIVGSLAVFLMQPLMGIGCILFTVGYSVRLIIKFLKSYRFSYAYLDKKTDEELDSLIREYKTNKESGVNMFGTPTTCGLVIDSGIAPWDQIRKMTFTSKKLHLFDLRGLIFKSHFTPSEMILTLNDGINILGFSQVIKSSHNVDTDIEKFIDSIPKYTDCRFTVDNQYTFFN